MGERELWEQVADGIYRVELPLPFALRSINCYLLRDGAGWTLIDCGLNYPPGRAAWQAAWAELGIEPRAISRIILTHAHPDHYGMAGWIAAQSGAPVLLSAAEQRFAERAWGAAEPEYRAIQAFFRWHGMPEPLCDSVYEQMTDLHALTQPTADGRLLQIDQPLRIGAREFQMIETPGHSDGHLVFYCAAERLMLCGDTVLARISPNIGLWPHGRPNPLADFLQSLGRLRMLSVDLALPGHRSLIRGFGERIDELLAHHQERLDAAVACADAATAFDICSSMFPVAELTPHQIRFAMAEALAHLEYLVDIGRLRRIGAAYPRYYRG